MSIKATGVDEGGREGSRLELKVPSSIFLCATAHHITNPTQSAEGQQKEAGCIFNCSAMRRQLQDLSSVESTARKTL